MRFDQAVLSVRMLEYPSFRTLHDTLYHQMRQLQTYTCRGQRGVFKQLKLCGYTLSWCFVCEAPLRDNPGESCRFKGD